MDTTTVLISAMAFFALAAFVLFWMWFFKKGELARTRMDFFSVIRTDFEDIAAIICYLEAINNANRYSFSQEERKQIDQFLRNQYRVLFWNKFKALAHTKGGFDTLITLQTQWIADEDLISNNFVNKCHLMLETVLRECLDYGHLKDIHSQLYNWQAMKNGPLNRSQSSIHLLHLFQKRAHEISVHELAALMSALPDVSGQGHDASTFETIANEISRGLGITNRPLIERMQQKSLKDMLCATWQRIIAKMQPAARTSKEMELVRRLQESFEVTYPVEPPPQKTAVAE